MPTSWPRAKKVGGSALHALSRRGALPVLALLAEQDPEAVSMTAFGREARISMGRARLLREDLVRLGLLQVATLEARGPVAPLLIQLTERGRRVAAQVVALRDELLS